MSLKIEIHSNIFPQKILFLFFSDSDDDCVCLDLDQSQMALYKKIKIKREKKEDSPPGVSEHLVRSRSPPPGNTIKKKVLSSDQVKH
jgi:hypothetical protein